MASPVDISNNALAYIGMPAEVIAIAPPDGSNEAQLCGRFYPMARDEVLESHPWSFATRRVALAEITNDRPEWHHAYQVPADCLKAWAVLPPDCTLENNGADFSVETTPTGSRAIYTTAPQATLRYTYALTDTTRMTPLVVAAISRLLASKLAGTVIKGSEGMRVAAAHLQIFMNELAAAKASDRASGEFRNRKAAYAPSAMRARGGDVRGDI